MRTCGRREKKLVIIIENWISAQEVGKSVMSRYDRIPMVWGVARRRHACPLPVAGRVRGHTAKLNTGRSAGFQTACQQCPLKAAFKQAEL